LKSDYVYSLQDYYVYSLQAIKGWHKAPLWTKLRWSSQDHFKHWLKQPQTKLTIWWWKGLTQSTFL